MLALAAGLKDAGRGDIPGEGLAGPVDATGCVVYIFEYYSDIERPVADERLMRRVTGTARRGFPR